MKVIRAQTAGFCMGVSLALQTLKKAIAIREQNGANASHGRICTLGPIIHNPQVLAAFSRQGVICLDEIGDAAAGDHVIIRAHGIPRSQEQILRSLCFQVEDATCPKVKKAQLAIADATSQNATLLLFGEAAHPEVQGLVSYACHKAFVFDSSEALERFSPDPQKAYVLAAQTTQDKASFAAIAGNLCARLPKLQILRTICDATRQRQEEALKIAANADAVIVIGGKDSGNTRRLASLTSQAGVDTFHVETVSELDAKDFAQKKCVALTAGASTPKSLIDAVESWLLDL